ncbi:MAG: GreA/GreB family elongation factor [Polyangiaceae bacterium]
MKGDRVAFGCTVVLSNENGDETTYKIVGADETDTDKGHISITSPLARAVPSARKRRRGQGFTPGGERTYEVVSVESGDLRL